MFKRLIASIVCLTFSLSNLQYVQAQDFNINQLPVPGTMVGESMPFAPLALKGLIVNPKKPLEFQFIVDTGKAPQDTASVKEEANQLVKYFLAGLTIPEGDLWVNLSPYEKNRMVPEALGQTDLGRDLLAQDYILKQLTASLIYPEKDLGKEFWSRVYAKAQQQFGTTNIPVNTFNKVWILPDEAQVYENINAAYVTKSTLKVMLDEDYTALQKHKPVRNGTDSIGSQIVRQIILPEITKEVNTGKNFAPLRQIYQALILAKWYKETIQNGLLDAVYTNRNKTAGVNVNDPAVKEQIYERYLKAYKKGAFNYIKEYPTPDGQVVPRKYFSGGTLMVIPLNVKGTEQEVESQKPDGAMIAITIGLVAAVGETLSFPSENPSSDSAMGSDKKILLSESFDKYNLGLYKGLAVAVPGFIFLFSFIIDAGLSSLFSNDSSFHSIILKFWGWLAVKSYEAFKLAVQDPNTYKITVIGVGLVTALLAWQNYSLQGLGSLLNKKFLDNEEVIKRLKNKKLNAVPVLAEYYREHHNKSELLTFLVEMGDKRAIEPIADVVSRGEGDFDKENEALRKLGADKDTILNANLKALGSNDRTKELAIKFLGDLGDKRAINNIIDILSKGEFVEISNEALQKLGVDKELLFQSNLKALSTKSNDVEAIGSLSNSGDARAILPIIDVLGRGEYILKAANDALKQLGASKEVIFQANLKALNDGNYNKLIIEFLGNSGDARAIDPIARLLSEGRYINECDVALKKLGADKEVLLQAYLKFVQETWDSKEYNNWGYIDQDHLKEVLALLGNLRDKRAIGALVHRLDDRYKDVRKVARESLGKLDVDHETMFQTNLRLLGSKDDDIVLEAVDALVSMGDQRGIKPLFGVIKHFEDKNYRQRIVRAIKKLGNGYPFTNGDITILNLVVRQPEGAQGSLFNFEQQALQYASEGYDFKVIYEAEKSHWVSSQYQYDPGSEVIDSSEVLRIERGEKFSDKPLISNVPDAARIETPTAPVAVQPVDNNPEAPPIEIQEQKADIPALNESLTEKIKIDHTLVNIALTRNQVPLDKIKDQRLNEFLQLLKLHGIEHLAVVGGAVRDIFYDKDINDIDIGGKLTLTTGERQNAVNVGSQATRQMYDQVWASLNQLAQVLNVPVERFLDNENPPVFNGLKLHYIGPHIFNSKITSLEIIPQGFIADEQSGNVYSSYTAPGILQMAIDSQGKMYGHSKALADALNGEAHLQGDLQEGRNLTLLGIVKWLRLKHEFGLGLDSGDYSLVRKAIDQQAKTTLSDHIKNLLHEDMQGLVNNASNPKAALNELTRLGLVRITGFTPVLNVNPINMSQKQKDDAAMLGWLKKKFFPQPVSLTALSNDELLINLSKVSSLQDLGNDYSQVEFLFLLLKDRNISSKLRDAVFNALIRIGLSYKLQQEIDLHNTRLLIALKDLGGENETKYLAGLLGLSRNPIVEKIIMGYMQKKRVSPIDILRMKAAIIKDEAMLDQKVATFKEELKDPNAEHPTGQPWGNFETDWVYYNSEGKEVGRSTAHTWSGFSGSIKWYTKDRIWAVGDIVQRNKDAAMGNDENKVYATNDELNYRTQAITVHQMRVDFPAYVGRFLRHINPESPYLEVPEFQSAIEQDKAKGRRISLVHEIPLAELQSSDGFHELVSAIRQTLAFKRGKIAFQDEQAMHFTLVGGLEGTGKSIEDLGVEFTSKLKGKLPIRIQVKGPWISNFIYGRVFLPVFPEKDKATGENKISILINAAGGKDFKVYAIPFFQLRDNLSIEEDDEIQGIFDRFRDRVLFEYDVNQLSVLSFSNDLLADKKEVAVIPKGDGRDQGRLDGEEQTDEAMLDQKVATFKEELKDPNAEHPTGQPWGNFETDWVYYNSEGKEVGRSTAHTWSGFSGSIKWYTKDRIWAVGDIVPRNKDAAMFANFRINSRINKILSDNEYRRWELESELRKFFANLNQMALGKLLMHKDSEVGFVAAKTLFDLGNRSREVLLRIDVHEKIISRQPIPERRLYSKASLYRNPRSLKDFERGAYKYALEGYDFRVIYRQEIYHFEEREFGPNLGYEGLPNIQEVLVIDSPEDLKIERGDKLPDHAMLQTPKQTPDAAMLFAKTRIAMWVRNDDVSKIDKILPILSDEDQSSRRVAREALDKLATSSDLKYQVGLAGLKSRDQETGLWSIRMLEKSGRMLTDSNSQYEAGENGINNVNLDIIKWAIGVLVKSGKKDRIKPITQILNLWGGGSNHYQIQTLRKAVENSDLETQFAVAVEVLSGLGDTGSDKESNYIWSLGVLSKLGQAGYRKEEVFNLILTKFEKDNDTTSAIPSQIARKTMDNLATNSELQYKAAIAGLKSNNSYNWSWAIEMLRKSGNSNYSNEMATIMKEAEKSKNYERFNRLSDELHKLDDSRGQWQYVLTGGKYIEGGWRTMISQDSGGVNVQGEDYWQDGYYINQHWELQPRDKAMLLTSKIISKANPAKNGGIDFNQINVLRNGKTVNVQFDPAQLNALEQGGFEGFTPVIINITRISSPFQLLGINTPKSL